MGREIYKLLLYARENKKAKMEQETNSNRNRKLGRKYCEKGGIRMYNYFISYNYNNRTGFGRREVRREDKINPIEDITSIEQDIKKEHKKLYNEDRNIIILNYKLLNEEEENNE